MEVLLDGSGVGPDTEGFGGLETFHPSLFQFYEYAFRWQSWKLWRVCQLYT